MSDDEGPETSEQGQDDTQSRHNDDESSGEERDSDNEASESDQSDSRKRKHAESSSESDGDEDEDEADRDQQDDDDDEEGDGEKRTKSKHSKVVETIISKAKPKQQEVGEEDEEDTLDLKDEEPAPAPHQEALNRLLLDSFSEDQERRYEAFVKSTFKKPTMLRYLQSLTGSQPNDRVVVIVGSVAKIFAGEVIELARSLMDARGEEGQILPYYLRVAARQLRERGAAPDTSHANSKPRRLPR
eukprot:m.281276 g.281276  ORF g.281276 m.281276 type:complete len:243 (+) comp54924_c0_seq4:69-797(+)